MEEKAIILKASFKGIISNLLLLILKFSITLIGFSLISRMKNIVFNKYSIGFRSSLVNPLNSDISLVDFGILYLSYILTVVLVVYLVIVLYQILSLLMAIPAKATFDYNREKIIIKKNISPFTMISEENVFNKIIEVTVSQNYIQRLLNTGTLYVEYLVLSEVDSHIRDIEFKYLLSPFEVKKKLI